MELRDYLDLARKWLWLFALSTAVAATGAWLVSLGVPTQYASQATLMVGQATQSETPDYLSLRVPIDLAQTYAQMATREPVLNRVVEDLQLTGSWQALRGMVKASQVPGSPLVEIRVIDTDVLRAQLIADSVARNLIAESPTPQQREILERQDFVNRQLTTLEAGIDGAMAELAEIDSQIGLATSARAIADLQNRKTAREQQIESWRRQYADLNATIKGSETNSLQIIEPAMPAYPVGPNRLMNVLFAAALGFGLALGAVLLMEYMDDTVKTTEGMERRLGLSGMATIERILDVQHRADGLVTIRQPRSPTAEAYRVLRTNLEFAMLGGSTRTLVVSSPNPGEGKSTTAANLAVALAQGDSKVILVDTDLRRPSIHRFFGMTNSVGLTSLLLSKDGHGFNGALQPVADVPGLKVLTSGPLPANPAEVLKSERMGEVFEKLKKQADLLILDSPPLHVVADAAILASRADGTLLVLECGTTRIDSARRALAVLTKVGVKPLGAVVNKLDKSRVGRYYYYYSYRYRYGEYYGSDRSGDGDGATPGSTTPGGSSSGGEHRRHRHSRPPVQWWERVREGLVTLLG